MGNHASNRSKKNRLEANHVSGSKIPRKYLMAPSLTTGNHLLHSLKHTNILALKLNLDEEIKFDKEKDYVIIKDK